MNNFEAWVFVIKGYSQYKKHYKVCYIKNFKSIPCNMVEFYRLLAENRDEIFDKCLSHTFLVRTHAHAIIVYHVSSVPGSRPLIKYKLWPR